MKLSVRIKVAIGLGVMGILILLDAAHSEPNGWHSWHDRLVEAWEFAKIGFLVYAAYLLMSDDEEINSLKSRNEICERLIQEITKQSKSSNS